MKNLWESILNQQSKNQLQKEIETPDILAHYIINDTSTPNYSSEYLSDGTLNIIHRGIMRISQFPELVQNLDCHKFKFQPETILNMKNNSLNGVDIQTQYPIHFLFGLGFSNCRIVVNSSIFEIEIKGYNKITPIKNCFLDCREILIENTTAKFSGTGFAQKNYNVLVMSHPKGPWMDVIQSWTKNYKLGAWFNEDKGFKKVDRFEGSDRPWLPPAIPIDPIKAFQLPTHTFPTIVINFDGAGFLITQHPESYKKCESISGWADMENGWKYTIIPRALSEHRFYYKYN